MTVVLRGYWHSLWEGAGCPGHQRSVPPPAPERWVNMPQNQCVLDPANTGTEESSIHTHTQRERGHESDVRHRKPHAVLCVKGKAPATASLPVRHPYLNIIPRFSSSPSPTRHHFTQDINRHSHVLFAHQRRRNYSEQALNAPVHTSP